MQEVYSALLLSVMKLLSATGFCIIFLSIVSRVLKERLYLRHVEVFRFVNKCGRDSGLGWSPIFSPFPIKTARCVNTHLAISHSIEFLILYCLNLFLTVSEETPYILAIFL